MAEIDNTCAICIETCVEVAYLSSCSHQFCFKCIKKWHACGKSSTPQTCVCPLCKRESRAILYHYDRLTETCDKYFFDPNIKSFLLTDDHRMRLQCYQKKSISSFLLDDITQFWERGIFLQRNKYREEWLRRELQALLRDENPDVLVHLVAGTIDAFCKRHTKRDATAEVLRKEFKENIIEVISTFMDAGERFVDETEVFLALRLNVAAFDCAYRRYQIQHADDLKIRLWASTQVRFLRANDKNDSDDVSQCIKAARSVRSYGQLADFFVSDLGFRSNKDTDLFAKTLFGKLSKSDQRECKVVKVKNNSQHDAVLDSLEPNMRKMLFASEKQGCSEEIITISAMMIAKVDAHKEEIARSDHVSMLIAYEAWQETEYSKRWCTENGVQFSKMENAKGIREKLESDLEKLGIKVHSKRNDLACIKMCIAEGYSETCSRFQSDGSYQRIRSPSTTKTIHPRSTVYEHLPMYVVHSDTSKTCMREVTEIKPTWFRQIAPQLYRLLEDRATKMPRAIGRAPI